MTPLVTRREPSAVPVATLTDLADHDQADHNEQRDGVQQVDEHVPGVCEDDHWFSASDSSHRPSTVKSTITTSMTTWERVAARAFP